MRFIVFLKPSLSTSIRFIVSILITNRDPLYHHRQENRVLRIFKAIFIVKNLCLEIPFPNT